MKTRLYFVMTGLLVWSSCADVELGEQTGTEVGNPAVPHVDPEDSPKPEMTSPGSNIRPTIDDSLVTMVEVEDGSLQIIGDAHAVVPAGAQLRGVVLRDGQRIHATVGDDDGSFVLSIADGDVASVVRFHAETAAGRSAVVDLSFVSLLDMHTGIVSVERSRAPGPTPRGLSCLATSHQIVDPGTSESVEFELTNTCSRPVYIFHEWQFGGVGMVVDLPDFLDASETRRVTVWASSDDFDLLLIRDSVKSREPNIPITVFSMLR